MAKQTLKARRSLKKGSLRRKTPAPKAETQKKTDAPAVIDTAAPLTGGWLPGTTLEQAYKEGQSDGWHAGIAAAALNAHIERGRSMIAADIGCFRWGPDLEIRFEEAELLDRRPSLLSRIKAWWRR